MAEAPGAAGVLALASRSLAEFVAADERARALVEGTGDLPDRSSYRSLLLDAFEGGGLAALRSEKRRRLAEIAARDVAGSLVLAGVGSALSDLADAALAVGLVAVEAPPSLAVIAMGKLGARELNYVSDIDVMFVADGDLQAATRAASALLRVLGEPAPEGRAYEVDANLRPEGRSGALVRSLESYLEYYGRWAKQWEFQALLKARAAAGNDALGRRLVDATRELVFPPEVTPERVAEIRRMKEQVESHATRSARSSGGDADDVKLGPGGIRDIEFSIQLLQLVHGASDDSVRQPATLDAIQALVEGGYIADDDAAGLDVAYTWLRTVEHRLQLWQERRVRHLPREEEERSRLARSLGFADSPSSSAAARFDARHRAVLADVRGRFEKLFYRPMIESLAEGGRLSGEALRERLTVLGFRDVTRAVRTLEGLVAGTSRRAKLVRLITPALLRHLAPTPLPDAGLFAFLRLGEALQNRVDALGALRDNPPGIEFLARVLGSGRILGEVLEHVPEELQTIADPAGPPPLKARERLIHEAGSSLGWRDPDRRMDGLRRFKRREMLAVALADLAGTAETQEVGEALANLADACLQAALQDLDVQLGVIGLGKLGGSELNYSSDIDVLFIHDDDPGRAEKAAEELLRAIGEVTPEGQAFRIDANLRPEGKKGPLARSLDSYLEYYERWAEPWEHQALIKARAVAGRLDLAEDFIRGTRRFTFPEQVGDDALAQIRHLKARMEKERVPKRTDPRRHMKMGPGGLSDIEFAAQVLQMRFGATYASLRVAGTRSALSHAADHELISAFDALRLIEAYDFLSKLRDRLFFMVGRPVDILPTKPEDEEALGVAMGYRSQPRQELEEEYLRITRRARRIVEPIIYG